jgi:UDP-glucose 4-epimerase
VQTRFLVTGGAGFLGSNLVNTILRRQLGEVTVFDNFLTGHRKHFGELINASQLTVVTGDAADYDAVVKAMANQDIVIHLAANSDIARAVNAPLIDFENGTRLTQTVLEAMRALGVKRILFTSGSGVYGDVPPEPIPEDYAHMIPISTYGASKLASETLISAYCHMFDFVGTVFRFANVVGPNMTHGVTHDFTRRLHTDPLRLQIFGDGYQSKPYIHVDDVVAAMLFMQARQTAGYEYYNVGSEDSLLVRDIAQIVAAELGLTDVKYEFTGGARGWRADVPVYRLDTSKIRSLGWRNHRNSREAVVAAAQSLIAEIAAGS